MNQLRHSVRQPSLRSTAEVSSRRPPRDRSTPSPTTDPTIADLTAKLKHSELQNDDLHLKSTRRSAGPAPSNENGANRVVGALRSSSLKDTNRDRFTVKDPRKLRPVAHPRSNSDSNRDANRDSIGHRFEAAKPPKEPEVWTLYLLLIN